jgi:hypothetical protein
MFNWLKYGPPRYLNERKPLPINALTYYDKDSDTPNNRFASYDSPDRFNENLKKQPVDWHYRSKDIFYDVNGSGYRTKDWLDIDWSNSIVIFGCSTVFGLGVAEDETIGYHLEKKTGKFVVNLGAPASSNSFLFYNSMLVAKNFPVPYAVVHVWTGLDRFTFFNKDNITHSGIWDMNKNEIDLMIGDGCNSIIHTKFLSLSSKLFWEDKTNYYDCSFFEEASYHLGCEWIPIDNKSRDFIHPGPNCTVQMADLIYDGIK